jgi:hypothetical protein
LIWRQAATENKRTRRPGEQVAAQLMMIETVHGIRLVYRDRLIDTIAGNAGDRRTASFVTAAINSWVAVNGIRGEIEIPGD